MRAMKGTTASLASSLEHARRKGKRNRKEPMRTFESVVLAVVSSTVAVAIVAQSESARAQQSPASAAQPRPLADRASEGAGATIFGNVCVACHGKEDIREAMSPEMLKQLTPEKLYE